MLYNLTVRAKRLYEMLQDEDIDEQTVNDTLEAMEADEKLESCAMLIRQLKADETALKDEKEWIEKKRSKISKDIDRFNEELRRFMEVSDQKSVKVGIFNISIVKNPPKTEIVNDELLDKQYFVPQPPKIDKAAIRAALLAGEEVPGAVLMTSTGVRIK